MRRLPGLVALVLLFVSVKPAAADITGFLGTDTTPSNRSVKGLAVGAGLLIVGFEFEYSATSDDILEGAPSLKTGMANLLLQTPVSVMRMQPYFTFGGGIYRERLQAFEETGVAANTGGGVKVTLAGPLRLRLDYRVFKLGSDALYSPSHRLYAGLNLKF